MPDLGTGLGTWDLVLRKLAHVAEYAVLGALLARSYPEASSRDCRRARSTPSPTSRIRRFVPGRRAQEGRPVDTVGVRLGASLALHRLRRECTRERVCVDLDGALGDTRPLWQDWVGARRSVLGVDPATATARPRRGRGGARRRRRGKLARAARALRGGAGARPPPAGSGRERRAPPARGGRHRPSACSPTRRRSWHGSRWPSSAQHGGGRAGGRHGRA